METFEQVLQRLQMDVTDFVTSMIALQGIPPVFGAPVALTIPAGKLSAVVPHGLPCVFTGAVVTTSTWPVFVSPPRLAGVEAERYVKVSITATQAFDVVATLLVY